MTKLHSLLEPVAPSDEESRMALDSSRRLAELPTTDFRFSFTLRIDDGTEAGKGAEAILLPSSALPLLKRMLAELGQGHAVALLPVESELTTQQAADLLNVSRPFLVGLIEARQIPCRKVGTHRRILLRDLLAFKKHNEADRLAALAELQAQAQELDMGY